tara:strand:+ start:2494 stop:4476 length:1983 start_codon:yes stop_codon:yes gene_type:complete
MSAKKIALDLLININAGDLTLEELNSQIALAKKQMKEMGDDGSEEFAALGQVVEDAEKSVAGLNDELANTKKGFDKTADAQKDASKGSKTFSTGLKAVGTAFKALGIGLVVAALKFLFDALSQNQKVMNVVNTVMETISIVMAKVVGTITDVVTKVSESTNGFEGLKNVMMGLLTLAITPLKLAFYGISLGVQEAQLAWETSFFGDDDPATVKRLTASIKETKESLKEVAVDAIKAGIEIGDNIGKAANEIGGVVSGAVEGISKISVKGAIEQAKTNVALTNSAQIAAAQQGLLVEQYDRLAEKQRQIRDEERNSIADRMKANVELGVVLEKQEKAMLAQASLQVAAAQAQVNKNKNTETETALIEALANKAGVLAAVEGFRSEQKVNELGLNRELLQMNAALGQSDADLAYARAKFNAEQITDKVKSLEALRALEEIRMQDEMLRLEGIVELANAGTQAEVDALIALDAFREESRQANIDADTALGEAKEALSKKTTDQEIKDADEVKASRIAAANGTLGALKGLADILAQGNEKQQKKAFQINKVASIGNAIINTATGATKAFAQGGVAGFATGAAIVAAGAAQIATISKTQYKGGDVSVDAPSPSLGSGDVGTQPRGFTSPRVDTSQSTTKVIVTETDIRSVTGNVSGIYNRAVVVE